LYVTIFFHHSSILVFLPFVFYSHKHTINYSIFLNEAWSSAREPEAVFTLLETIYRAFDMVAKRRRVFKVEVVGDCYVAVCGLPDPRKDHFSVMCRFAQDCLNAMQTLAKELEVTLGPDTGDLMLRVGLHSGPVVAGVLRGEKSRFQLFGDTVRCYVVVIVLCFDVADRRNAFLSFHLCMCPFYR
jgi:hypothetical protein